LDIGVLGYIGIVQHKEHSPEVLSIPPGTPCIQPVFSRLSLLGKQTKQCHVLTMGSSVLLYRNYAARTAFSLSAVTQLSVTFNLNGQRSVNNAI